MVCQALAAAFEDVKDRTGVRMVCRIQPNELSGVLEPFPSYFRVVAEELKY